MRVLQAAIVLFAAWSTSPAEAQIIEQDVKSTIAGWYGELAKGREARIFDQLAPGGLVVPSHDCNARDQLQPRALQWNGPYPHLLARRAQKFAYEIESTRLEPTLARVSVWERGWIYAWAAKQTYENAAAATFVLEKREGEPWKVLLYASQSQAVRPQHRHEPMPDLAPKEP